MFSKSKNTKLEKSNPKVSDEELKSLREAFTLYDKDKNGAINLQEFADIVKSLEIVTEEKKIQSLVKEVDSNQDGHIDFNEFVNAMTTLLGSTQQDNSLRKWSTYPIGGDDKKEKTYTRRMSKHETDELRLCFEKFDKNGDGQISVNELKEVMDRLGEKLSENELKEMINDADTNKDGFIDFEEFKALIPASDTK
ncbi:hypothetical protein BDF21DRAFT_404045 [Thamnidium elegans]|uniref:EF-hand domain-containing protein n=1 Tax=Thamnidium elegans TaxID=101142 RepID=A0A8H7VW83_9FUNG|nr:hypothetical protein INT48_003083 [Thamnidium elegans]KAI8053596.1 hypothetical protein BDF21DRAFT_404045 [Thamnidium elegans]